MDQEMNELFIGLILGIQTSVMVHLGKMQNPATSKIERNLEAARESIDLLLVIEEKTRGNLSEDEDKLLKSVLRELRLNFIEETKKDSTSEKNIDEKEEN
jgi:hypothetical protein